MHASFPPRSARSRSRKSTGRTKTSLSQAACLQTPPPPMPPSTANLPPPNPHRQTPSSWPGVLMQDPRGYSQKRSMQHAGWLQSQTYGDGDSIKRPPAPLRARERHTDPKHTTFCLNPSHTNAFLAATCRGRILGFTSVYQGARNLQAFKFSRVQRNSGVASEFLGSISSPSMNEAYFRPVAWLESG